MPDTSKNPRRPAVKRARGRPTGSELTGFDSLLRGARQIFATQGYEGTSVREIARLAGVDPALMSHHFGSKEGLWKAVVEQLSEQLAPLIESTRQLQNSRHSPRERIKQALMLFIDHLFEDRYIGMFFSTATTEQGERLNLLIERLMLPYREAFVPLLVDAMEAGKIKAHDPDIMHYMMVNAISSAVSYSHVLSKFSALPENPDAFKQSVLEIAFGIFR
ncbi:TetR/AcrR family transcriptional regulator [Paraburkholderia bannensis]|uniref:TetR/AcrR family transcriptional regulator n=1 Tax=Paraburkholderia bannensis TaxID=765414 RepID=UPI002AC3524E|nr:TetR/AcrR family transcriptional regulator [Paraburkholderia bannensis]